MQTATRVLTAILFTIGLNGPLLSADPSPRLGDDTRAWTERLIPLPKEITVSGSITVRLRDIELLPCSSTAPPVTTARGILRSLTRNEGEPPRVAIAMTLLADADDGVPQSVAHRLEAVPNREQAYAIIASAPNGNAQTRIALVANTATGLLYATQTLRQLLRVPAQRDPDTIVEVPLLTIVDWPDLRSRGFFGVPGEHLIDHCAHLKLNVSLIHGGCRLDSTGQPIVADNVKLIARGAAVGVKLVPDFQHLDVIAESVLKPALFRSDWAHLLPVLMTDAQGRRSQHCVCFSSPATAHLMTHWLEELSKQAQAGHQEVFIFLTEQPRDTCHCKTCLASGKNHYALELEAWSKAISAVRRTYPGTFFHIGISQGVRLKDATQTVIDALPAATSLTYYDGRKTYVTDRAPMVPQWLGRYAHAGGSAGIMPQISFHFRNVVPMTSPQFLRFRMQEFVDKRLDVVYAYAPPRAFTVFLYKPAVAALAEYSWNAEGRSCEDFARAYATLTQTCESKVFGEWAALAGKASYDLASSNFLARLFTNPTMGFYGSVPLDRLLKHSRIHDIPHLAETVQTAEQALRIARKARSLDVINESEFILNGLKIFAVLKRLSPHIHAKRVNQQARLDAAACMDELDECAHCFRVALFDWADRTLATTPMRYLNQRFMNTALAPLRTGDVVRNVASTLGISDPRPESRILPVGEWSPAGFSRNLGTFTFDVPDQAKRGGGLHNVTFDHLEGEDLYVRKVALLHADPGKPKSPRVLATSPDTGRGPYPRPRSSGGLFTGARIDIPATSADTKLFLRIVFYAYSTAGRSFPEDYPAKQRQCAGLVGLRRVYRRGEFPRDRSSTTDETGPQSKDAAQTVTTRKRDRDTIRVGISKGLGAEPLCAVLGRQKGIEALVVERVTLASLSDCDVLIVCQKLQPIRLIRAMPTLVGWVRNGGRAMFLHDAVGYRQHPAIFKNIGGGAAHPKASQVRVRSQHPVTDGLTVGQVFSPGYRYDHVVITPGPDGKVLVRSEEQYRRPVIVVGGFGAGKVVLNGMCPGLTSTPESPHARDDGPVDAELKLLLNCVCWLAE